MGIRGVGGGVGGWMGCGFSRRPHGKIWILINLGYRVYPKYSYPYSLPYTSLQQVHLRYTCECVQNYYVSGKHCTH